MTRDIVRGGGYLHIFIIIEEYRYFIREKVGYVALQHNLFLKTYLSNAYMYTFFTFNTLPRHSLPPLNVLHFNQAHRNRAFVLFEIFYCYKLL